MGDNSFVDQKLLDKGEILLGPIGATAAVVVRKKKPSSAATPPPMVRKKKPPPVARKKKPPPVARKKKPPPVARKKPVPVVRKKKTNRASRYVQHVKKGTLGERIQARAKSFKKYKSPLKSINYM